MAEEPEEEKSIDDDPEAVPLEGEAELSEEEMRKAMAPKPKKIELEGKSMVDFEFFRQRKIQNKAGQDTGHGLVAVPKDSGIIQIEYTCPYCQHEGYDEQEAPGSFG